jgi:hypothetical protein
LDVVVGVKLVPFTPRLKLALSAVGEAGVRLVMVGDDKLAIGTNSKEPPQPTSHRDALRTAIKRNQGVNAKAAGEAAVNPRMNERRFRIEAPSEAKISLAATSQTPRRSGRSALDRVVWTVAVIWLVRLRNRPELGDGKITFV